MLIEFSCPVCQTPLAIKKQAIGGQVNCPKCQKLILLPSESPLPRHDPEKPPFHNGETYRIQEVTHAICTSVEPYRRDLETKTNLLNDAVEMVKIRNERIRELETIMLNTQGELWALEVVVDEAESKEQESEELHTLRLEKEELIRKKDALKARLANMIVHSETLGRSLKAYRDMLGQEGELQQEMERIREQCDRQITLLSESGACTVEAGGWIQKCSSRLRECHEQLRATEAARSEMEVLVHASGEDIQRAVDERNQWRKRSADLDKKNSEFTHRIEKLELRLQETEGLENDWAQDRETARNLRLEMEDNLQLLRERIERERAEHRSALQLLEKDLTAAFEKKQASLNRKLEKSTADLAASETKRMDALKAQQVLADQNMAAELEMGELRKQLHAALERVEDLEIPK